MTSLRPVIFTLYGKIRDQTCNSLREICKFNAQSIEYTDVRAFWNSARGRFFMSEKVKRNILLNPGPSTTTDTVKYAQIVPDICPREKEFAGIMAPMRDDLVRIVHGDTKEFTSVLFCGSGTICIDVTLNSLLEEGKQALVIKNGSSPTYF